MNRTDQAANIAALILSLALVVGARVVEAGAVFQRGLLVSPGNDPYYFRFWLDQLTVDGLAALPSDSRPVTHLGNWLVADLVGVDIVVAVLPVASAVVTALLVYDIALLASDDRRVGLAAVVILALTPVHANYTQLAYLDHQTWQYPSLALLVWALVLDASRRSPRLVISAVATGTIASTFSWAGSPLTFLPVAAYLTARAFVDLRDDRSALHSMRPLLVGLLVGAVAVVTLHLGAGWSSTLIAAVPLLTALGGIAVATLATFLRRRNESRLWYPLTLSVSGMLGLAAVDYGPVGVGAVSSRAADLFGRPAVAEAAGLFAPGHGFIFRPAVQLGLGAYLGFAALLAGTVFAYQRKRRDWLVIAIVSWAYLMLAAIQTRFAGQLALLLCLWTGVGLIHLLDWLDLARPLDVSVSRPSLPDSGTQAAVLVALVGVVLVFQGLPIPVLLDQTTYDSDEVAAVQALSADAGDNDTVYIISQWGEARFYNYFVSGDGRSYAFTYARENNDYQKSGYPETDRVDYVVINDWEVTDRPVVYRSDNLTAIQA